MLSQNQIEKHLETLPTAEALQWVATHCKESAFSTAFGEEDQIITHMIAINRLPIHIFTLDTGRLFNETYELLDLSQKHFKLKIEVILPDGQEVQNYVNTQGINGFYDSLLKRKECCRVRKIEPLKKVLKPYKLWITGLRRAQSENRQTMAKVEWDSNLNIIKYNPLLDWSDEEIQDYLKLYHIPTNPLHKKGFESIGCAPCTRAILPGETARAGRWWWESSAKECGLHQTKVTL